MALNINGRMKVKTLRADFKKEFGLTFRVYDGRSFADEDATLASIRKGDSKGSEFSPKRNTKVGNLEDKIEEMFGIKTQVAGSDDSYLCDNDLTLAGALEEDEKKMGRKQNKKVGKIKKRFFELTVWGHGGEYTAGLINDQEQIDLLLEKKEADELGIENYNDDYSIEASFFDEDDIMHLYNINLNDGPQFTVREIKDDSDDVEYISEEPVWEGTRDDILEFTGSTPYVGDTIRSEATSENSIIFLGLSYEKKMEGTFTIETNGEDFNPNNLFFETVNMDEVLNAEEVLTKIYYFSLEELEKFMKNKIETDENKNIFEKYWADYKNEIKEKPYMISEFLGELMFELKKAKGLSAGKVESINDFINFELSQVKEYEGLGNFTEAHLLNLDGEEL